MGATAETPDSTGPAEAELVTSPPPGWLRTADSRRWPIVNLAAGDAVSDDAENHAKVPPCDTIAFPVITGDELLTESLDNTTGELFAPLPDPAPATDGRHKIVALYLPKHPRVPLELLIVHTDDAGTAAMHSVRLASTDNLHPLLETSSEAGDIVVTPERWFIPVTVTTYLDLSHLVPGDVDHRAIDVHDIYDYWRGGQQLGLTLRGYHDSVGDERLAFQCFASWDQMGVTSEHSAEWYSKYTDGFMGPSPYPDIDQIFGYVLTAPWGGEPVRAQLPVNRGRCCKIEILDAGFVAISDVVQAGEHAWPEDAPPVHYSSDGLTWEAVDLPTRYVSYDGGPSFEVPIWICSVHSAEPGVVVREARGIGWERCSDFAYWTADGDLTNWRKLLAPPPGYD